MARNPLGRNPLGLSSLSNRPLTTRARTCDAGRACCEFRRLAYRADDVRCGRLTRQGTVTAAARKGLSMTDHVIVTEEGAARVIKLRRPEKKNALTQAMYRRMSEAIDTAQNNPD